MNAVEKDPTKGLNAALADVLNAKRVTRGLTFDDLARRSGVSKSTLLRLLGKNTEKRRHIDVSVLASLVNALDMKVSDAIEDAERELHRQAEAAREAEPLARAARESLRKTEGELAADAMGAAMRKARGPSKHRATDETA